MKPASQFRRHRQRLTVALGLTLLLGLIGLPGQGRSCVNAEDQVFLRASSGSGESRVVGDVEEYTGVELVFRHRSGREQTFDASRVARIESLWSAPHQTARDKFREGQFQESLDAYLQALRAEKRKWVQRQQLARITWCYRNLGKLELAASAFLALYRSDPSTMHFAAIPLIWTTVPLDAAVERRAEKLLSDAAQPAGQLIGASWLITSARRVDALQALRKLSNAEDARLIFLSEAQTWRTQLATVTDEGAAGWQTRINTMPQAIRSGPYFLLGTAHARLGKPTEAALALMRVRINYPDDRLLSARSLLAAGQELAPRNPQEARAIYREIIVDYADTSAATTARQQHAKLSATSSASSVNAGGSVKE